MIYSGRFVITVSEVTQSSLDVALGDRVWGDAGAGVGLGGPRGLFQP